MNSFSLYIWKHFLPLFVKNISPIYSIPEWLFRYFFFPFSASKISCHRHWPTSFSMRSLLSSLLLPFRKEQVFFLWLLLRFSLYHWFGDILLWYALAEFSSFFFFLKVCWVSWISRSIAANKFGGRLVIISSSIFLTRSIMYVIESWRPSPSALMICSFLILFFSSVCFIADNLHFYVKSANLFFGRVSPAITTRYSFHPTHWFSKTNYKFSLGLLCIYHGSTYHFQSSLVFPNLWNDVIITGLTVPVC